MKRYNRYAVYYAPPRGSPLAIFGAHWLGWDAETGRDVPHPHVAHLPRPASELTSTPRKYGFHATLKPPFALYDGADPADLLEDLAAFARGRPAFEIPRLRVATLGRFVALTPAGDVPELSRLAAAAVERLDRHRRPAAPAELAQRRAAGLTARQSENLERWGYPYVFEEFRFHMTLSGALPADDGAALAATLAEEMAPLLADPVPVADVALFGESDDGRFRIVARCPLGPPQG